MITRPTPPPSHHQNGRNATGVGGYPITGAMLTAFATLKDGNGGT